MKTIIILSALFALNYFTYQGFKECAKEPTDYICDSCYSLHPFILGVAEPTLYLIDNQ